MTHIIKIVNIQEDTEISREMNDAEFAQYTADQQAYATEQTEQIAADKIIIDAKASRDAKLAKMGFTAAEIENW